MDDSSTADSHRTPTVVQARVLVFVAAIMWSTSGFFVKSPYLTEWEGPRIAFWRGVMASLVLLPLVRKPRWTWQIIPMCLCFVGMTYSYLTAMHAGSVANAIWLQCTAPAWVLIVGVFVFGERAIARDWIMLVCAAVGVAFILYYESRGASFSAVLWGLSSGAFYAGVVLSLRQLRGYDPVWLAALNNLATMIALAYFAYGPGQMPSGMQWIYLAGIGILQMAIPYVLFAHGLKRIPGHEATAIGLIEPILNPTWVLLAWNEWPAWWTVVGALCILVGLGIRYLWPTGPDNNRMADELLTID